MQDHTSNTQDTSLQSKTFWVSEDLLPFLSTGDDSNCDAATQFQLEQFIASEEIEDGEFVIGGEGVEPRRCDVLCRIARCKQITWLNP